MKRLTQGWVLLIMWVVFFILQIGGYELLNHWVAEPYERIDRKLQWTAVMFFIYPYLCFLIYSRRFKECRKREFTLTSFTLTYLQGIGTYTERFDFPPFRVTVPYGTKVFYIDMEDTDQPEGAMLTDPFKTIPRLHYNLDSIEQFDEADIIKVRIEDGVVEVKYLGPTYVKAAIGWGSKVITE